MRTLRMVATIALAALLVACGGDPAQRNRDSLGAVEASYTIAQNGAILYRGLTPCSVNPTPPCRDRATYEKIQEIDRRATAAIEAAHARVRLNPTDAAIPGLIAAAQAAVGNLKTATPATIK
jgi:hypothetical protein